jgi:hypothetical protein
VGSPVFEYGVVLKWLGVVGNASENRKVGVGIHPSVGFHGVLVTNENVKVSVFVNGAKRLDKMQA